jgi:hypothetical protein
VSVDASGTSLIDRLHDLPAAVYRLGVGAELPGPRATIEGQGFRISFVDGSLVDGKRSFLRQVYKALDCPAYAALNWDAFEDVLNDLDWLVSDLVVLVYDDVTFFASEHPRQWGVALDILSTAAIASRAAERRLYVLLGGEHASLRDLPLMADAH